jgi:alpha/beta superfamily hydrolase
MHLELEKSVCGIQEPFVFWLWSSMAGRPDSTRIDGLSNVEDISVQTVDGRTLRGYKLKAQVLGRDSADAKEYLLVVQGNAMLADQILSKFTRFSSAGIDVYIFDYRGYGRSEGKRRLKAMVNDYGEIIDLLNSRPYSSRLFYAMSFGGIVLLNALQEGRQANSIVIDSTPSRLSDHGCPEAYDPINNLPEDGSNFLFIVGAQDRVVTPGMSRELVETARQRGALVLRDPEMAHPLMDRNMLIHDRRMEAISTFLLRRVAVGEE